MATTLIEAASIQPRPATIREMLERPDTVRRFQQIVPRHLSPERMLRVMAHAVHKTPRLAQCTPITLLGAMQACASLGLEPNTPLGHAYLVPYRAKRWNPATRRREEVVEIELIIGYRGYIDLARRTGKLISIHADVAYEGDRFEVEYGSNMHLTHVPMGQRQRPVWAYAHATLADGEAFEALPYPLAIAARDQSQGYRAALAAKAEAEADSGKAYRMREYLECPWVAHEHEMVAKTMVRRLAKWLPMSIEFANAIALEHASADGKVDFAAFSAAEGAADFDPALAPAAAEDQDQDSPAGATLPPAGDGGGGPARPSGTPATTPPAAGQGGDDQGAAAPAEPPALFGTED